MQKKRSKKLLSMLLCMVLVVAMALFTTGCGKDKPEGNTSDTEVEAKVLGQGKTVFNFTVVDKDGNESAFEIHTDKTIVGDALMEHDLLAGDAGDFGLYVKSVNGITADYDVDGTYWAFYINGEYAMSGVDSTEITDGAAYTFKVEK